MSLLCRFNNYCQKHPEKRVTCDIIECVLHSVCIVLKKDSRDQICEGIGSSEQEAKREAVELLTISEPYVDINNYSFDYRFKGMNMFRCVVSKNNVAISEGTGVSKKEAKTKAVRRFFDAEDGITHVGTLMSEKSDSRVNMDNKAVIQPVGRGFGENVGLNGIVIKQEDVITVEREQLEGPYAFNKRSAEKRLLEESTQIKRCRRKSANSDEVESCNTNILVSTINNTQSVPNGLPVNFPTRLENTPIKNEIVSPAVRSNVNVSLQRNTSGVFENAPIKNEIVSPAVRSSVDVLLQRDISYVKLMKPISPPGVNPSDLGLLEGTFFESETGLSNLSLKVRPSLGDRDSCVSPLRDISYVKLKKPISPPGVKPSDLGLLEGTFFEGETGLSNLSLKVRPSLGDRDSLSDLLSSSRRNSSIATTDKIGEGSEIEWSRYSDEVEHDFIGLHNTEEQLSSSHDNETKTNHCVQLVMKTPATQIKPILVHPSTKREGLKKAVSFSLCKSRRKRNSQISRSRKSVASLETPKRVKKAKCCFLCFSEKTCGNSGNDILPRSSRLQNTSGLPKRVKNAKSLKTPLRRSARIQKTPVNTTGGLTLDGKSTAQQERYKIVQTNVNKTKKAKINIASSSEILSDEVRPRHEEYMKAGSSQVGERSQSRAKKYKTVKSKEEEQGTSLATSRSRGKKCAATVQPIGEEQPGPSEPMETNVTTNRRKTTKVPRKVATSKSKKVLDLAPFNLVEIRIMIPKLPEEICQMGGIQTGSNSETLRTVTKTRKPKTTKETETNKENISPASGKSAAPKNTIRGKKRVYQPEENFRSYNFRTRQGASQNKH